MSVFSINLAEMKRAITGLENYEQALEKGYSQVKCVADSLDGDMKTAKAMIDNILWNMRDETAKVRQLKEAGYNIISEIAMTENNLAADEDILSENPFNEFFENISEKIGKFVDELIITPEERVEMENRINELINNNPDIINMSDSEKNELISLYEKLYPKQGNDIDEFLAPLEKNGHDEHIQNIKLLAYTAEEPYKSMFFENIGRFSIKDEPLPEGGSQNYSARDKEIWIDVNGWETNSITRDTYTTFFHECGHAIDDVVILGDATLSDSYRNENNQYLKDILEMDVRNCIRTNVDEYFVSSENNYSELQKMLIKFEVEKAIMNCADFEKYPPTFSNIDVEKCYDTVVYDIRQTVSCTSSDIYGGFTGNTLKTDSAHGAVSEHNGVQSSYWIYEEAGKEGDGTFEPEIESDGSYSYKDSISHEFFADYFAAHMSRDSDELAGVDTQFPEGSIFFEDMVSVMQ